MDGALEQLREVIDRVLDAELSDSESVVELHRQLARLDAGTTEAVSRWDADRDWAADGARSGPSWLMARCRTPERSARRRVKLGRAMRGLPVAAEAWKQGEIESAHLAVLAVARTDRTAELLARDEAMLVDEARKLRFSHFQRVVAYWCQQADPNGVEDDAERLRDNRRLDVSTTFKGAVVGDFVLDPIGGAIVTNELKRIEDRLFKADWADAKERLGREPLTHELLRTAKQRRADALIEMAIRSRTPPKDGRRPAPLFSVFVNYETLAGRICELANGTVVTPGSLLPYLTEADIEWVVWDSPSRVIDVGETRRFFVGATRRTVEVNGRECYHDTCEERCNLQVDHVLPAAAGGPTVQANGRLACGFHNRLRNRRPRAG